MAQRPCALDPFALAGIVHRFPQVCPRWTLSQKSGLLPNTRARISAVAAVTARRLLHSSLTCLR